MKNFMVYLYKILKSIIFRSIDFASKSANIKMQAFLVFKIIVYFVLVLTGICMYLQKHF